MLSQPQATEQYGLFSKKTLKLAGITFSNPPPSSAHEVPPKKKHNKDSKVPPKPVNTTQYEIKGYIKDNYVRINIQITNNNLLTGYMFIEDGPAKYVYGKLANGVLYMYDSHGELYTVLFEE
jgi:hypothetical protein